MFPNTVADFGDGLPSLKLLRERRQRGELLTDVGLGEGLAWAERPMVATFFSRGVRGVRGVKDPDEDVEEDGRGMTEGAADREAAVFTSLVGR